MVINSKWSIWLYIYLFYTVLMQSLYFYTILSILSTFKTLLCSSLLLSCVEKPMKDDGMQTNSMDLFISIITYWVHITTPLIYCRIRITYVMIWTAYRFLIIMNSSTSSSLLLLLLISISTVFIMKWIENIHIQILYYPSFDRLLLWKGIWAESIDNLS